MSAYEYTDPNGDTLNILPGIDDGNVWVEVGHHETGWVMSVAHEDAPAVALAILEAAGIRSEGDTLDHSYASHVIEGAKALRKAINIKSEQVEREAEDAKVVEFHTAIGANLNRIERHHRDLYNAARKFFEES